MQDLKDRVAVVTGGASGIGLATARALAREGAKLVLADVEAPALASAVESLAAQGARVIGVPTDVSDLAQVTRLATRAWQHFGAVHVLFNNAGVSPFGLVQDMTHADWQWTVNVNLWGPIHGVEAFVPRMIEQKQGGHVLFTASFAGLVANRALAPYSVTKAAVVSLAECLVKDLRDTGIGVSVLCPMRVATAIDESHRNRPAELGGPDARNEYADKASGALEGRTLAVDQVAAMVIDAIRANTLYVITHKETDRDVERRF